MLKVVPAASAVHVSDARLSGWS